MNIQLKLWSRTEELPISLPPVTWNCYVNFLKSDIHALGYISYKIKISISQLQ